MQVPPRGSGRKPLVGLAVGDRAGGSGSRRGELRDEDEEETRVERGGSVRGLRADAVRALMDAVEGIELLTLSVWAE